MKDRHRTFLHDITDFTGMAIQSLSDDEFTKCFSPISPLEIERAGIFYIFSFLARYLILFPLRLIFLLLATLLFVPPFLYHIYFTNATTKEELSNCVWLKRNKSGMRKTSVHSCKRGHVSNDGSGKTSCMTNESSLCEGRRDCANDESKSLSKNKNICKKDIITKSNISSQSSLEKYPETDDYLIKNNEYNNLSEDLLVEDTNLDLPDIITSSQKLSIKKCEDTDLDLDTFPKNIIDTIQDIDMCTDKDTLGETCLKITEDISISSKNTEPTQVSTTKRSSFNTNKTLELLFLLYYKSFLFAIGGCIHHHGTKIRHKIPHLYVSNHTSFVDYILLSSHKFPHACISENHGGLFGFIFSTLLKRIGSISFKRSEKFDRERVFKRMKSHIFGDEYYDGNKVNIEKDCGKESRYHNNIDKNVRCNSFILNKVNIEKDCGRVSKCHNNIDKNVRCDSFLLNKVNIEKDCGKESRYHNNIDKNVRCDSFLINKVNIENDNLNEEQRDMDLNKEDSDKRIVLDTEEGISDLSQPKNIKKDFTINKTNDDINSKINANRIENKNMNNMSSKNGDHINNTAYSAKTNENVNAPNKKDLKNPSMLPMLVFPEGTCVNNKYTVLFQKGAFEMGCTIIPVAIKFRRNIMDPYWNRRKHNFTAHLFYLMTRWKLEADVWWMQPVSKFKDETSTEFAGRVKEMISERGGLKSVLWNGYFKSSPVMKDREILREAFRAVFVRKEVIEKIGRKSEHRFKGKIGQFCNETVSEMGGSAGSYNPFNISNKPCLMDDNFDNKYNNHAYEKYNTDDEWYLCAKTKNFNSNLMQRKNDQNEFNSKEFKSNEEKVINNEIDTSIVNNINLKENHAPKYNSSKEINHKINSIPNKNIKNDAPNNNKSNLQNKDLKKQAYNNIKNKNTCTNKILISEKENNKLLDLRSSFKNRNHGKEKLYFEKYTYSEFLDRVLKEYLEIKSKPNHKIKITETWWGYRDFTI